MILVGITGGSGAGKTFFCQQLQKNINRSSCIISQDEYYKDHSNIQPENRKKINFDHPDSIDYDLFYKHLELLQKGYSIETPHYDFQTQTRTNKTTRIQPKDIIIVEGILIMNDTMLKNLYDYTIFIDIESKHRLDRIIGRDNIERGRAREETIKRFNKIVEPMFLKYIYPWKDKVDCICKSSIPDNNIINQINLLKT